MLKLTKIHYIKILILYTVLGLAVLCCFNLKSLLGPATKRPFSCSDESIKKPFILRDTVSPAELYILGIYAPVALIAACELYSSLLTRQTLSNAKWMMKYVLKCCVLLTLYVTGLALERLTKNLAKHKMGRLRPNFIKACEPINAAGYSCLYDATLVMQEYECSSETNPSWALTSAFSSFPSGHTSLASYAMIFLICYLNLMAFNLKKFQMFSHLVIVIGQVLCFFVILFMGMSRVLDFRHHWSDVAAGFVLGSSIALVINWYLKEQMPNIEMWLKEVVGDHRENEEGTKDYFSQDDTNDKEEPHTIEMEPAVKSQTVCA